MFVPNRTNNVSKKPSGPKSSSDPDKEARLFRDNSLERDKAKYKTTSYFVCTCFKYSTMVDSVIVLGGIVPLISIRLIWKTGNGNTNLSSKWSQTKKNSYYLYIIFLNILSW